MRRVTAIIAGLGVCLATASGFAETIVNIGTVSQFSSPSDLDLTGDFVKAVNFAGPDLTVSGLTFSSDEGDPDFVGPNDIASWATRPEFGDSTDDDNLEQIMHSIRFALNSSADTTLEAHIGVEAGQLYKIQLLISANRNEARRWDIEIEGIEAVDEIFSLGLDTDTYDIGRSMVYAHTLIAGDDTLDIRMGNLFGEISSGDPNPIWQAMTVELVPEPTTTSLMLLGLLAAFATTGRNGRGKTSFL